MKKMLVLLVVAFFCVQAQAVVYDIGDDFPALGSGGPNPTGAWSYVCSDDLTNDNDALMTAYVEYEGNRSAYWRAAGEGYWPLTWHSFSYTDGSIMPGDTIMQPACGNNIYQTGPKFSKIRWTAPAAGIVDLSAAFHDFSSILNAWVVVNDTIVYSSTDPMDGSYAVSGLAVLLGDTIDFAASTSPIGQVPNPLVVGLVRTDATINFVPEPVTMSLLGLGGLVMIRRRRA